MSGFILIKPGHSTAISDSQITGQFSDQFINLEIQHTINLMYQNFRITGEADRTKCRVLFSIPFGWSSLSDFGGYYNEIKKLKQAYPSRILHFVLDIDNYGHVYRLSVGAGREVRLELENGRDGI